MNPCILHHKVVMVLHASIISESEVSITVLVSAMFTLLHSNTNQKLFKKYLCNQSSHYENIDSVVHPSYRPKLKYPFPYSVSYVQLVHYTAVWIKNCLKSTSICNRGSHYEKYGWFLLCKESHHVQPPNQCFSLSTKLNGTQKRTLVSPWRKHCTYCCMPKGTYQAEAMSKIEKSSL